jgi:hypothetical protein
MGSSGLPQVGNEQPGPVRDVLGLGKFDPAEQRVLGIDKNDPDYLVAVQFPPVTGQ